MLNIRHNNISKTTPLKRGGWGVLLLVILISSCTSEPHVNSIVLKSSITRLIPNGSARVFSISMV